MDQKSNRKNTKMNYEDRKNLEFLLVIDEETFRDWCKQATADDIAYAIELMVRSRHDPRYRQFYEAEALDEIVELDEAREVLSKFVTELK